ncbi:glycosyltransferase family 4 protein [Novosphingobium sp.]|uniref:glycosyltransferase family 4 protein n=1 Tax=Novosphingobium sp. TaxID=1874826 RepID=UPI003B51DD0B
MRILIITHFYESHGGGIERVAGHVCRALAAQGATCVWAASLANALPDEMAITALPLHCIDPAERITGLPMPIPGPSAVFRLFRALRESDVVIVHDALYLTSIVAILGARLHRKPVILMQHIAGIEFASRFMRKAMALANYIVTKPMLRRADQVVFISENVRRSFAGVGFRRRPRVIFNGVDQAYFYPGAADRARFALPSDSPVVVFAGRFVEKKGLTIVRALAGRCPDVIFALAGSGPINPRSWNLGNVRLVDTLAPSEMGALFRSADLLLLPSVGEGYPLVIQEAMACGLAVVCGTDSASADPGASHWLQAVPIDLADPEECAERIAPLITQVYNNDLDRAAMAEYAMATYSWARMGEALNMIAQSLMLAARSI